MDLSGARGILVNITSGMDLTMEEFEVVGNAVKAFASENATVVVGTVIDPNMQDELRVTVWWQPVSARIASRKSRWVKTTATAERPLRLPLQEQAASQYEEPRSKVANADAAQSRAEPDYLDIPAFLRKQAD